MIDSMTTGPVLTAAERAFLDCRAASRAGHDRDRTAGRDPCPICFVLDADEPVLYTPIDDKPKRDDDPLSLARVRDIAADPRVTVLVDRWDEDWTRLAWLRAERPAPACSTPATGEHDHARIVAALRARYPQYADAPTRRPAAHPDRRSSA